MIFKQRDIILLEFVPIILPDMIICENIDINFVVTIFVIVRLTCTYF